MRASELVSSILRGILPRPDLADIREEPLTGAVQVVVILPPEQLQFAVGHAGVTADAIRGVLRAWGGLHKMACYLKVIPMVESETKEADGRTTQAG